MTPEVMSSMRPVALLVPARWRRWRFVSLGGGGASARSLGPGGNSARSAAAAPARSASALWLARSASAAEALRLLLSPTLLFGPGRGFGFCGTTVMVVLAQCRSHCPGSLSRRARSQGFPIPADNFPDELAV